MDTFKVSGYVVWFVSILSAIYLIHVASAYIFDTRTTIVFCDVGQGDAAYLRINNRVDILIDAGPDNQVLECLGRYMPFFDRTIEIAFLSHPHLDHYGGYLKLSGRYSIKRFYKSEKNIHTALYSKLIKKMTENNTTVMPLYRGDKISVLDSEFEVLWPEVSFIEASNNSEDLNALSQVLHFRQRSTDILFTGDINPEIAHRLLQQPIPKVDILKVPHHGSTKGLTKEFLSLADPTYSVISSGKANRYRHPHLEIINMLAESGTETKRTDTLGAVVFRFQ